MSFGDYSHYQRWYTDKSSDTVLGTGDTSKTLITCKDANHQIYVQKVSYNPVTPAAQAVTIEDSGVPLVLDTIPASQALPVNLDFGPRGTPLGAGKNLLAVPASAGPAAQIHVEAYERIVNAAINAGGSGGE